MRDVNIPQATELGSWVWYDFARSKGLREGTFVMTKKAPARKPLSGTKKKFTQVASQKQAAPKETRAASTKQAAKSGTSKELPLRTGSALLSEVMAQLTQLSSKATLDGMARYGIPSTNAMGVAMKDIKALGKQIGKNHELALQLWASDVYEARLLVSFVGDPERLTAKQMNEWCAKFDNWAVCDTLCFNLFDRSTHAWAQVEKWSSAKPEFVKRTAFALLWSLSVHDKQASDEAFIGGLALIEQHAKDERNFVKKAVNMALRAIGKRNAKLRAAATRVAARLAQSEDATARWIGRDALKDWAK